MTNHDQPVTEFAQRVGREGAVAVQGGQTRWTTGGILSPEAQVVKAPSGITDYQPEEMIVKVRAGTTVTELDHVLTERGQRSALPCRSVNSTVGGALAVGENDLALLSKGAIRNSLLQVRYVSAEGKIITAGGPTVKNVSGFDLPRLMVGALGTLGLMAEVILRTNPKPQTSIWFHSASIDPFQLRDRASSTAVIITDGRQVWFLLEGYGPVVAADHALITQLGPMAEIQAPPPLPPCRWSLPQHHVRALVDRQPVSDGTPLPTGPFMASVGTGLVWAEQPQPRRTLDPVVKTINDRLKANFDPSGRLNPGRDPALR